MDTLTNSMIRSLCVYCGSSDGTTPNYRAAAKQLGHCLGESGIQLVYGGGNSGLMGTVAAATLDSGGSVTGIIPEFLLPKEQAGLKELRGDIDMVVVPNMHVRKQMMFEKADAFVALPGGIGTLEEIVEILTWSQLQRHTKPVAILNTDGFWTPFVDLLNHMADKGFLHNSDRARPLVAETAAQVLPMIIERSLTLSEHS